MTTDKVTPLYALTQADIADLGMLINAATLNITANNARRVAQLQQILAVAQPVATLEQLEQAIKARDSLMVENAKLASELNKLRGDEARGATMRDEARAPR